MLMYLRPAVKALSRGAAEAGVPCITVGAGFAAALAEHEPIEIVDRDPQDTSVILYTSGTTGTPKGAELTNASVGRNVEIAIGLVDMTSDDVVFGGLPLFHS